MTGFCGAIPRRRGAADAQFIGLARRAEQLLSRREGDVIRCEAGPQGFIAYYNNGAWGQRRLIRENETLVAVSGDPLIVEADGITNSPEASAKTLSAALVRQDDTVIAATKGSFAAVAWEPSASSLQLCADKLALRPVYVYVDDAICIFSSTIRVLRELASTPLEVDEQGLAEHIYLGQCLGSRTIHKDVRVLRPGEILTVSADHVASRFYHRWERTPRSGLNERQTLSALYNAFVRALKRRSRNTTEDAFLSGGLDSRCVVAGLLDAGRAVRSFGSSYAGSADDVISRMVADAFGTSHTADERDPADRLKLRMDTFALYAQTSFPTQDSRSKIGRILWSGDGGSVGMGHVYMNSRRVALAAGPLDEDAIKLLFPRLARRTTRLMDAKTMERLRKLAIEGVKDEFDRLRSAPSDRRLFFFYLLNDQMRHLWHHYEDIDISAAEFETPFFDADFLELVAGSPIEWFLRHKLYNKWLTCFRAPAAALPWQVYPGHEPGPHPMPAGIRAQWSKEWYSGAKGRWVIDHLTRQALECRDPRVARYIQRPRLIALRWMNLLGLERFQYEQRMAVGIVQAIVGSLAGAAQAVQDDGGTSAGGDAPVSTQPQARYEAVG